MAIEPAASMPIGRVSGLSGVKVTTIRYYEAEGLLPPTSRTASGRRAYCGDDVRRLRFIRHARQLGFEMEDLRALLELADMPDHSCAEADRIARRHLEAVNARIARLASLRAELERMVETCSHGTVAECRVIDTLAEPHDHGPLV